jgi:hypothetical protein
LVATRKFTLSEDGIESQFASNYLGHFLLTNLLIKHGVVSSGRRIVNVGSLGYQMDNIHYDNINYKVMALYILQSIPSTDSIVIGWQVIQWLESVRPVEIRANSRDPCVIPASSKQGNHCPGCSSRR